MRTRTWIVVFAAVVAARAGVFIKDQQYRFCSPGGECAEFCAGPGPRCEKWEDHKPTDKPLPLVVTTPKYRMTFIEYKENGTPFDRAQLEVARDLITQARKASARPGERLGPASVFLYVHGWKNNANDRGDDADVARFGRYLEMYSEYVKCENRPVVGVYLAWRGRSLELPGWISWLTFWTRSAAARRVGSGPDLNNDIDKLVQVVVEGRRNLGTGRRPYVFVMGHSFGARVLETAVIGPERNTITGSCRTLALDQKPVGVPADLVLFENAATSAAYVRRQLLSCQPCGNKKNGCKDFNKPDFSKSVMARTDTFDRAQCAANPSERKCQPYSLVMAVSSSKDYLTRVVLFLASFQHPAAFFPWRQTHHIAPASATDTIDPMKDQVFMFETPADEQKGKPAQPYMVHRKNTNTISPVNPVWVIEVSPSISSSHGDVWNATMMNMIVNMTAADGVTHDPALCTELPLPPPPERNAEPTVRPQEAPPVASKGVIRQPVKIEKGGRSQTTK